VSTARPDASTALAVMLCERPRVRWQCAHHPKPCRWTNCRYNLQSDRNGKHATAQPVVDCALDLVDAGGTYALDDVGKMLGITRERVRQIEADAIRKLRHTCSERGIEWQEFCTAVGFPTQSLFDKGDGRYFIDAWRADQTERANRKRAEKARRAFLAWARKQGAKR
jgi:hypothetical protein